MDPNEALANIRLWIQKDRQSGDTLEPHEVEQLVDLIAGLDDWLGSGGYLPKDWAAAVGLGSDRERPEVRDYLTQTGTPVQAILLPGGAAVVTWRPGTDNEVVSRETEHWVDNEVKYGWLVAVTKV